MEKTCALLPCRLSREALAAPLPFDLYNDNGLLLAKQGALLGRGAEALADQALYRPREAVEVDDQQFLTRLETAFRHYGETLERWSCCAEDVLALKRQAADLVYLGDSRSDLCLATVAHLPGKSHATRHAFATAIVAILLGNALGWHLRRQHVLARAALTMNLSLLAMHDDWARSRCPLSQVQRGNVTRHPGLSAELLLQSPGVDLAWIAAVDQHHENLDGSGYPVGLQGGEIGPEARVLRVADAWCALTLLRAGKARKTPKEAMQELSRFAGRHYDLEVLQALKNLMGPYPPGTFVRLANRETAIVMRWDRRGTLPRYATRVLSPAGVMPREFKVRPLTQQAYEIRDYTYPDIAQLARFSVSRLWAAGAV